MVVTVLSFSLASHLVTTLDFQFIWMCTVHSDFNNAYVPSPKNNNILDGLTVSSKPLFALGTLHCTVFLQKKRSKRKCCDLGATS